MTPAPISTLPAAPSGAPGTGPVRASAAPGDAFAGLLHDATSEQPETGRPPRGARARAEEAAGELLATAPGPPPAPAATGPARDSKLEQTAGPGLAGTAIDAPTGTGAAAAPAPAGPAATPISGAPLSSAPVPATGEATPASSGAPAAPTATAPPATGTAAPAPAAVAAGDDAPVAPPSLAPPSLVPEYQGPEYQGPTGPGPLAPGQSDQGATTQVEVDQAGTQASPRGDAAAPGAAPATDVDAAPTARPAHASAPAVPATPATPATPAAVTQLLDATAASTPASPATPATPATPASTLVHRATPVPLGHAAETLRMTIQAARDSGTTRARIALRPAELGGVEVALAHTVHGVTATVTADSAAAAAALQKAADDLQRALAAQGLELLRLDIGVAGDGRGRSPDDPDHPGRHLGRREHDGDDSADSPISTIALPGGQLVDVLA